MSSIYPTGIDAFTTKLDNVDDVMAADVNNLQDSVVAIQETLGTGVTNFLRVSGGTMTGDLNFAASIGITAEANFQAMASLNTIIVGGGGIELNDNVDSKLMHINSDAITLADNAPGGGAYLYLRNNNVEVEGGNGFVVNAITGNITLNTTQNIITSGNITTVSSGVFNIGSPEKPFGTVYADDIVDTSGVGMFVRRTGDTMTGDLNFAASVGITAEANFQAMASLNTIVIGGGGIELNDNVDSKLIHINSDAITLADNSIGGGAYLYLRNNNVEVEGGNGFVVNAITGNITLNTTQDIITSGNITTVSSGVFNIGSSSSMFSNVYASTGTFTDVITNSIKNDGSDIFIRGDVGSIYLDSDSGIYLNATGVSPYTTFSVDNGSITLTAANIALETPNGSATIDMNSENVTITSTGVTSEISLTSASNTAINSVSGTIAAQTSRLYLNHSNKIEASASIAIEAGVQDNGFTISSTGIRLVTSAFYGTPINLTSQNISGVNITSTNGDISILTGGAIRTSGNISPRPSGVDNLGSVSNPFGSVYSRQYATSFISGLSSTGNITINWNSGTTQHLDFSSAPSGTGIIAMTNGIAGSAYLLTTKQNPSGTVLLTWSSDIIWHGGVSGTLTASSGVTDMFNFVYNGSKYLGSFSNNYF